jgi:RIO kinase 1
MEFIGDVDRAAPRLANARLSRADAASAWQQLLASVRALVAAGVVHGDLSAYNLLWWEDELVFIDFPQAVDLAANPSGLDFLHRDVRNVCRYFERRGVEHDPEEVFADLVTYAFG